MQKAACICPALLCHYWMSVTVETGAARSNSRSETQQIWMSRQCLGSLFFLGGVSIYFFGGGKWKGNDNSIWLWPRAVTFVKSIVRALCVFFPAMTKRWVVLICRPHAVILSWHSGFDKPLLSAVCLRWQEASRSTARRRSSWTAAARLRGTGISMLHLATPPLCVAEAEREWLSQVDL